jgi:hypothetical protein
MDDATLITISSIGGGAGAGTENTIYLQGAGSIGRKVTDTSAPGSGFGAEPATTQDLTATGTYQTALLKFNVTTSPDLQSLANVGLALRIGSSATAYYQYDVEGSDTYPARGGWLTLAIDPNIAGYRDATNGNPALTAVDYWGILALFTAGGAKDLNVLLDAIDIGNGLSMTGGTGADPDGTFADFVSFDEGTSNNRFGYAFTNSIGLEVNGTLEIGVVPPCVFTDSDKVVSFSDGRFAAGWSGLSLGLTNSADNITWSGMTFLGKGTQAGTTDTRPILVADGTTGVHTATACLFDAFASLTLTSVCTYSNCSITNSGAITPAGADMTGCTVLAPTVAADASAVVWNVATDPNGLLDNMSIEKGANAHHAIEFGLNSPTTMTLEGIDFSGFNATDAQNDSTLYIARTTGTVTINLSNCTGNVSYKSAGAIVVIQASVPVTITVLDDSTGLPIANTPRVALYNDTTNALIDSAAVNGSGVYSYSYTAATPQAIFGWVREQDLSTPDYVQQDFSGTIGSGGFTLTIRLKRI